MKRLLATVSPFLLVLAIAEAAFIAVPALTRRARRIEQSPALAGKRVAARAGCFGCHGDGGHGKVPNPGAKDDVPGFRGGMLMMFAQSPAEIREWIADGMPRSWAADQDFLERRKSQTVRMPAFKGKLSDLEIDELVAYVRAVGEDLVPPDGTPAAAGLDIARSAGCFGCHGSEGMGGIGNVGSFKGYVPGFWGDDFRELVTSDLELREWIENGRIARLESDAMARRFVDGQAIAMPAFKGRLEPGQIDKVAAYVKWVNEQGAAAGRH